MTIAEKVEKDLVAAMKAREQLKLSVLRMAKTSLKHKQIEVGAPLNDDQTIAVLRTLVKQRRDSVEQFRKGGREDLAAKEEAETEILQAYLPVEAGEDEISAAVAAAIQETGAAGPQDLGKVMKAAMQKLAGKNADGKRVNQIVRAKLGG
ncbi:MAG TPA: GatB/YqeY domain-containing protein [Terriglobia bacterium]|nr:GatB/YqeY domain-containing protein [Terriglobia bacterium]